jgi:hypothetical protein
MCPTSSITVESICFIDPVGVLGPQDAGVADQARSAACGVCAATEAEEEKLVTWLKILDKE